jgi:hypothetical protein
VKVLVEMVVLVLAVVVVVLVTTASVEMVVLELFTLGTRDRKI